MAVDEAAAEAEQCFDDDVDVASLLSDVEALRSAQQRATTRLEEVQSQIFDLVRPHKKELLTTYQKASQLRAEITGLGEKLRAAASAASDAQQSFLRKQEDLDGYEACLRRQVGVVDASATTLDAIAEMADATAGAEKLLESHRLLAACRELATGANAWDRMDALCANHTGKPPSKPAIASALCARLQALRSRVGHTLSALLSAAIKVDDDTLEANAALESGTVSGVDATISLSEVIAAMHAVGDLPEALAALGKDLTAFAARMVNTSRGLSARPVTGQGGAQTGALLSLTPFVGADEAKRSLEAVQSSVGAVAALFEALNDPGLLGMRLPPRAGQGDGTPEESVLACLAPRIWPSLSEAVVARVTEALSQLGAASGLLAGGPQGSPSRHQEMQRLLVSLEERARALGLVPEGSTTLADFAARIHAEAAAAMRQLALARVRKLAADAYRGDACPAKVGLGTATPAAVDHNADALMAPPCLQVSSNALEVARLAHALLTEAAAPGATAESARLLCGTAHDALDVWRALAPHALNGTLHTVPGLGMLLCNDLLYLAHGYAALALECRARLPAKALADAAFTDTAAALEVDACTQSGAQLDRQRGVVRGFLEDAAAFVGGAAGDSRAAGASVQQALHHLRHLAGVWRPLLAAPVLEEALGSLVDVCAGELCAAVLSRASERGRRARAEGLPSAVPSLLRLFVDGLDQACDEHCAATPASRAAFRARAVDLARLREMASLLEGSGGSGPGAGAGHGGTETSALEAADLDKVLSLVP